MSIEALAQRNPGLAEYFSGRAGKQLRADNNDVPLIKAREIVPELSTATDEVRLSAEARALLQPQRQDNQPDPTRTEFVSGLVQKAEEFFNTLDINQDGSVNPREFIYGFLENAQETSGLSDEEFAPLKRTAYSLFLAASNTPATPDRQGNISLLEQPEVSKTEFLAWLRDLHSLAK